MAIDSMRKAYARDEVRELIEAREKAERDEISRMHQARQEGLQEGLEKGLEEGRTEERSSIARRLLEAGLGRKQIQTATGLSPEELDRL